MRGSGLIAGLFAQALMTLDQRSSINGMSNGPAAKVRSNKRHKGRNKMVRDSFKVNPAGSKIARLCFEGRATMKCGKFMCRHVKA